MIVTDQTENDKCIFMQAEISSGRLGGGEHRVTQARVLASEGDAGSDDCDCGKSDTLEITL